jgi:hypothetical protein
VWGKYLVNDDRAGMMKMSRVKHRLPRAHPFGGTVDSARMTLIADLEAFIHSHRPHGALTADATPPAWNGCLLTVACPCGVVFERWVTPEDADADLLGIARLN